ncbi:MAG: bacillithiol biosynthesis deacetylase BshB1 [Saprospiraceae bacterium]
MKVDILAFGAHPDDVELSCSGTLLKHIAEGKTVGLVDLTKGELGTRGSAALRKEEAEKARQLMGALFREQLDMPDGFFIYSQENILKVVKAIRAHQPEIVLANSLDDRHPDHGKGAKIVADACFYAGLAKIETFDEDGNPQKHHRPKNCFHYIQDRNLEPDFVVDITEFMDKKIELVKAFGSQFYNPDDPTYKKELETPISGKDFMFFLKAKAASYGRVANFTYAEGFNTSRTPGVKNLFDLV